VSLVTLGILSVGVTLSISIHVLLSKQADGIEREDFLSSVNLLTELFDLSMQSTLEVIPMIKLLTNQTLGPPILTRAEFDETRAAVLAGFPTIVSLAYSTVLLDTQLDAWPCTVEPTAPSFLPNQTRFIVTTYLENGLEDFECKDIYARTLDRPLLDTIIALEAQVGSFVNFNVARDEFTHFIVVGVSGSRNPDDPSLLGSVVTIVAPLSLVFDRVSSSSIYTTVASGGTRIFETVPFIEGPKEFHTCKDIPLTMPSGKVIDEWRFCFQGEEDSFRQSEERQFILFISLLVVTICLVAAVFGIYVENASRKRTEAAGSSQRQMASWVCHDMRAPLARLSLASELGPVRAETLCKEVTKMQAVIRNILEIDRLMLGSSTTSSQDVVLDEWIAEFFPSLLPPKPMRLTLAVGERVPTHLHFDKARVEQILTNLLHNAAKHTCDGNVDVFLDSNEKGDLFASVTNRADKELPDPSRLYKPPPNYRLQAKIFSDTPSPELEAYAESHSKLRQSQTMDVVPSSGPHTSVGWGLTIVKMLVLGMGGDFFISRSPSGVVSARFVLPTRANSRASHEGATPAQEPAEVSAV
jgi:signal transduction histidine kinase